MKEIETKKCSKCGEVKQVSDFNKNKSNKDGYNGRCKLCIKKYKKEHYQINKDYIKNKSRKWLANNKERAAEKHKEYYLANKEHIKEYLNRYYQKNKDIISEYGKEYYLANKDKIIGKIKIYRDNNSDYLREKKIERMSLIAKYELYKDRLTIEEEPICGENGELLCKCSYCKEYFPVTNGDIHNRYQTIIGNMPRGEHRLYCGDECKGLCPIFGQKKYPKGFITDNQARCNQNRVREILLDIQFDEIGCNWCDKCGDIFEPEDLFFHHNIPIGDDPTEYDNAAHYMLVCKDHHEHKGCLGNLYE